MRKKSFIILYLFFPGTIFTGVAQSSVNFNLQQKIPIAFQFHPEYGKIKLEGSPQSVEQIHLRDANSRTFLNPDGSFSKQTSSLPIHFKEGEFWVSIKKDIEMNSTGNYMTHPFVNSPNIFKSYYPQKANEGIITSFDKSGVINELKKARMYYLVNGGEQNSTDISNSNATTNDNIINYSNIYGNSINLRVTQLNGRRKLDYIIEDISAINNAPANSSHLVFEETIELPEGWKAELKDNMILLIDRTGECIARYDKPMIHEQKTLNIEHIKGSINNAQAKYSPLYEGVYEIQKKDNKLVILTKIELAWLLDAKRQFPVVVDPDLVASAAWAGWYYSYNYSAPSSQSATTSGAPGGSTITNVNLAINATDIYYYDNFWAYWDGPWPDSYCNSWYSWELDGSLGTWAAWICAGNYSNWNGQDPNQTWTLWFSSWDGDEYACYFGFTVTVTYTVPCTTPTAGSISPSSTLLCSSASVTINSTVDATAPGATLYIEWYRWNGTAWTYLGQNNSQTITDAPGAGTYYYLRRSWSSCYTNCVPGCIDATTSWVTFDGTAPSHDNLTVNSNCWITDNTQNYTITLVSTESGMGFGGSYGIMALINYQGANAGQYGGYFSWHPTSYVWTLDQVAATGGGFASKNSGYGAGTITLVSCATSLAGNQRTVVFTVRPNSSFPTLTANDISMYTSDACNNQAGWTNYDLNFTSGASALGTVSNAGPIDFCDAGGNFTTAVTVSSNVGSVMWDWGSNNGVWNNNWIAGNTSGVCCFPKQVSTSDGTADRMRYRVTNGSCPTVTSSTILIRDRWNEAPTSLTASATPVCSGTSVTLTANFPATINLRGTVDFYSGSCGGTFITSVAGSGGSSVTTNVTPPVGTTTYYAWYNPGTGTGCAVSACVSVSVTAAAAPTIATNSSTQSICSTGNAALSGNNPSVGTGVWSVVSGPSTSSAQFANTAVYNTTFTPAGGAGSYVVRWTISNSPCTPSSADATITVSANPVSISIAASPSSTICSGTNVTFTATPTNGGPGPTYQWKLNGGNVGTNSTTYSNSSLVNGDVITCILTSNATCPTGNPATSNSIAMTVNLYSTAPSSATATPSSIPLGNSSTLTLTGGSLGTSASWQWYSSSCGVTSAGSGSSITVSPSSTTTYYVRAEGTCNNTSCVSVTVTVTSFPIGVVNNGVRIYISSGTTVYIDEVSAGNADYINLSNGSSDGRVECQSSTAVIKLEGDWVNDAATGNADATGNNVFYNNGGEVQFIGSAAQTIGGATSTNFSNLKINNTISGNGGVTINTNATVNGLLTLTDGHLISPAAGRLTLGTAATVSPSSAAGAGSASSFISGHLDRVLNATGTNYDFPMGDSPGNTWRPMRLTAKDATARTWSAQFIKTDPISVYGSSITSGESLKGMNNTYYYTVSRTPSSGNVDIKMWYDPADQSVLESDIVIGHWCDATCGTSKWDNWSKNNMTPGVEWDWDATNNWVQVLNIGTFSPLAPGRKAFPLPIELLSFNAKCSNSTINISWMTATETNNDFFTIERSCDNKDNYEIIGVVKGAGNSSEVNSYSYLDINFPGGECYYRLKQTDFDGRYEYFNIEPVNCNRTEGDLEFNLVASLPNPTKDLVFIFYTSDTEQKITVETFDVVGRLITSEITEARKGYNNSVVDLTEVSNGFYYINISNGQKHFIKKIVKRY